MLLKIAIVVLTSSVGQMATVEDALPAPAASAGPLAAGESTPGWSGAELEHAAEISAGADPWPAPPTYYDFLANQPLTLRMEYLHWWLPGNPLPELVSTSPLGTPLDQAGVPGLPDTQILLGGDDVDSSGRKGFRGTLGVRLEHWSEALVGCEIEARIVVLGHDQVSGDFYADSSSFPILARPYRDAAAGGVPAALPVAYPGLAAPPLALTGGSVATDTSSDLYGAGLVWRRCWSTGDTFRLDWLLGYRYLRFQEDLAIGQSQEFVDLNSGAVSVLDAFDSFSAFSDFHGVDFGLAAELERGPLAIEVQARLALGNVHQVSTIFGETLLFENGSLATAEAGGMLAQVSNMGRHAGDRFVAAPELDVSMRRQLTRTLSATLGYTLMALPGALRTGDQIDSALDATPAASRPRASLRDSVLWIHGVNVGIEW